MLSYTDSLWIVGGEGYPGDLVTTEVWLQYEGGGYGDSITSFSIPLTYDAVICSVEAITIGPEFEGWEDFSIIDNHGTEGPPPVPKIVVDALTFRPPPCCNPIARGSHLAATVDFRILSSAAPPESTCIDTLMQAFTGPLEFRDRTGWVRYVPSFSPDCIRVVDYYCGDTNADGRITSADIVYMGNYIYGHGPDPYGQADVNLDGRITVADGIYLAHYIYHRGPEPCNPP